MWNVSELFFPVACPQILGITLITHSFSSGVVSPVACCKQVDIPNY